MRPTLDSSVSHPSLQSRFGLFSMRHFATIGIAAILFLMAFRAPAADGGNGRRNPQGFRVIDKNGALVGYPVTENLVAREIDGLWVTFYVHPLVGIFDSEAIYLHFLTTDCTGVSYVTHYSTFSEGTRVGARLYYPTDQQLLNPRSLRVSYGGTREDGPCYPASNIQGIYGVAATVDVSSFGLELPFRAVQ